MRQSQLRFQYRDYEFVKRMALFQFAIGTRHTEEALSREDMIASRIRVAKVLPYQRSAPFISNLSLAIFSGLLLVFAFPDWNLWSLGWVGTAPLIMAVIRERRFWRSLLLGYVTGTIFYVGSCHWVTHSFHNYGGIPMWLSYLFLTVLASALGIFTGLFAAVLALAIKRFGGWAILAAPILWAASEWARIKATGTGWNALGYSQAFQPSVIGISRIGGVYIVSALLVAASTAMVFALIYLERRRGLIVLSSVGVLAIITVLYGQGIKPAQEHKGSVTVGVIQPNVPIDGPWQDPAFLDRMTAQHISLSEQIIHESNKELSSAQNGDAAPNSDVMVSDQAAKKAGVDLVIWPESPMNFDYDSDPPLRRRLAEFTVRNDVYLLMNSWGYPQAIKTNAEKTIHNSAMVIGPSGERIFQYDKIALVPFGEYVPGKSWVPFMGRVTALVGDITPGTSFALSDVRGAKIGTTICFETTDPVIARRFRREGASALVQISNELWFGPYAASRQMLAHAVFRAVENDIEFIRATNSGLSARISSYGVVDDETPMFDKATRRWNVDTTEEASIHALTFYTRYGDLFAVACFALSLLMAVASVLPENWKRKKEDDD
jgi:apolipoprotein N-acyltransferase